MPGIQKLHLEDALDDSPRARQLLSVFEEDAMELKKYTANLHFCCQRILNAQNELSSATQALSQHLTSYEKQSFVLNNDDSILGSTLKQFSSYIDDLSSMQQVLSTQLTDGMMYPLTRFLQADIEDTVTMANMCQFTSNELEQSLTRYMKLPKKKDNERMRQDSVDELYTLRKKSHQVVTELSQSLTRYMKLPKKKDNERMRQDSVDELYTLRKKSHQTALHYYSALNSLQYKRRCHLLEPMIGYFHAQQAYLQMCTDAMCRKEIGDFLDNITSSIQEVKAELNNETQKTVSMMDVLEKQGSHIYSAEPRGDMPYIPPNTTLTQKSGYMFMRSRQMLTFKWERYYFFIQGGNIMIQSKSQVAGSLLADLNEPSLFVEPTDCDDRRYVFHLSSPLTKRTVILQAENERERDEWIHTIRNIIEEEAARERKKKPVQLAPTGRPPRSKSTAEVIAIPRTRDKRNTSKYTSCHSSECIVFGYTERKIVSPQDRPSLGAVPRTPPSSPTEPFFMDTPIQFDMISPNADATSTSLAGGPPKRINPFDQSTGSVLADSSNDNAAFSETYLVRFCGSMEVRTDKGEKLIHATIRQIMAARAIHNIFKMTESRFVVSSNSMRLLDPASGSLRLEFSLEDISYWSPHKENTRLFGFITRSRSQQGPTYACHVFESDVSAEEICKSISTSTAIALQALLEKKAQETKASREKDLLLYNISNLPDKDDVFHEADENLQKPADNVVKLPDDGATKNSDNEIYVKDSGLSGDLSSDSYTPEDTVYNEGVTPEEELNPPISEHRGDGDERKIEGAESNA